MFIIFHLEKEISFWTRIPWVIDPMSPWVEGSSLGALAPAASSYPSLNSQGQAWLIAR